MLIYHIGLKKIVSYDNNQIKKFTITKRNPRDSNLIINFSVLYSKSFNLLVSFKYNGVKF